MSLFLLICVPLGSLILSRLCPPPSVALSISTVLRSVVFMLIIFIFATVFATWDHFTGNLWTIIPGLVFCDVLFIPGLVLLAYWLVLQKKNPHDEVDWYQLTFWLVIMFSLVGLREFLMADRQTDFTELFLIPVIRLLQIALLPALFTSLLATKLTWRQVFKLVGFVAILVLPVGAKWLDYAGWAWGAGFLVLSVLVFLFFQYRQNLKKAP